MFGLFLTPAYAPFVIAFFVMIGIGLVEAIGLGLGSLHLDGDLGGDADLDGLHSGDVLGWLGLGGGLPILIWLTALLGCFTLIGIAAQQIATAITGAALAPLLAGGIAAGCGLVVNAFAAAGLARIMPGYESSVVSVDDLLLQRGTVLEGTASRGKPARAKVIDHNGQPHYVMIEPHHDSDVVAQGETALLVRREGRTFYVLPDTPMLGAL